MYSFFFLFIYFYQLEANYFTLLQWVLSYIDMNQPWSYIYSPSRSPLPLPSPPDVQNRLLDPVGEGKGVMFRENSIETFILSIVKQITSPGWMHETSAWAWCTGKTQHKHFYVDLIFIKSLPSVKICITIQDKYLYFPN